MRAFIIICRHKQQKRISMSDLDQDRPTGKAAGGYARAKALSAEQKKEQAKKAADARWSNDAPTAEYEGVFMIGKTEVSAAVIAGGTRLITQATFLRALGRSRSPKAGTGVLASVDGLPFFLQAEALKPFINSELVASTKPVFYRYKSGKKAVGYRAQLLPEVAEVYLQLRDYHVSDRKST